MNRAKHIKGSTKVNRLWGREIFISFFFFTFEYFLNLSLDYVLQMMGKLLLLS